MDNSWFGPGHHATLDVAVGASWSLQHEPARVGVSGLRACSFDHMDRQRLTENRPAPPRPKNILALAGPPIRPGAQHVGEYHF